MNDWLDCDRIILFSKVKCLKNLIQFNKVEYRYFSQIQNSFQVFRCFLCSNTANRVAQHFTFICLFLLFGSFFFFNLFSSAEFAITNSPVLRRDYTYFEENQPKGKRQPITCLSYEESKVKLKQQVVPCLLPILSSNNQHLSTTTWVTW